MGKVILRVARDGTVLEDCYKERLAEIERERAGNLIAEREEAARIAFFKAKEDEKRRKLGKSYHFVGIYEAEARFGKQIRRAHYIEGVSSDTLAQDFGLTYDVVREILLGGK